MSRLKISSAEHSRRIREGVARAKALKQIAAERRAIGLPSELKPAARKRKVSGESAERLRAFAAVLQALAPLPVADARRLLETALGLLP